MNKFPWERGEKRQTRIDNNDSRNSPIKQGEGGRRNPTGEGKKVNEGEERSWDSSNPLKRKN